MGLIAGSRDREVGAFSLRGREQPLDEILGKERRIARHADHPFRCRRLQARMKSGKRAGIAGNGIGDHRMPEGTIVVLVAIGVDQQVLDLRRKPSQHMPDHRLAAKAHQALVDIAAVALHPAREAAGQDEPGYSDCSLPSVRHQCGLIRLRPDREGASCLGCRK